MIKVKTMWTTVVHWLSKSQLSYGSFDLNLDGWGHISPLQLLPGTAENHLKGTVT
jgi:hypothetical protein